MIEALLAIDIGGSTSRAVLVDRQGNCLGLGRNGGGNPGSNPPELAAAAVVAAAAAAVAEVGAPLDIKVAVLAMAGPRHDDVRRLIEDGLRRLGLSGDLVLTSDTPAMLPSVTAATSGYCVFAGTGSGAIRVRDGEIDGVVDAAGWLLGDLGSGYWLGHQAAIAVTAALEGRGPATALSHALLDRFGIADDATRDRNGRPASLQIFIDRIYRLRPIELAQFAPLVLANPTDPVAAELLAQAEKYLVADFEHIFDPALRGPVVLGGSVAAKLGGLPRAIAARLAAAGHEPDIRLAGDGAVGAAVLALRHQGVTVDAPLLHRIAASITSRTKAVT